MDFRIEEGGFTGKSNLYHVRCNLKTNRAIITQNGEIRDYCEFKFPDPVSNKLQVFDGQIMIFEVDLQGNDYHEWVKQLIKSFADYLQDEAVILDYYDIDGVLIALKL